MKIPRNFNGRNPQSRRDLASTLRDRTQDLTPPPPGTRPRRPTAHAGGATGEIERAAQPAARAPLPRLPRPRGPRPLGRALLQARPGRRRRCKRRIEQRTNTIARQFDRVCEVLTALGYLDGRRHRHGDRPRPRLMRIYTEHGPGRRRVRCAQGLWDGLTPSGLAAVLSALVYESRRPDDAGRAAASRRTRSSRCSPRWSRLWADLDAARARAPARLLPRARPRLRLGGVPLGRGRRARRGPRRHRPRRGRLRALGQAAARPRRPGGRRGRRHRAPRHRARDRRAAPPRRGRLLLGVLLTSS